MDVFSLCASACCLLEYACGFQGCQRNNENANALDGVSRGNGGKGANIWVRFGAKVGDMAEESGLCTHQGGATADDGGGAREAASS